jgi:hypothetical protein
MSLVIDQHDNAVAEAVTGRSWLRGELRENGVDVSYLGGQISPDAPR